MVEYGKEYSLNELREIFDLPIVSGGALTQQIKNISKYYDIKKVKRGTYIINKKLNILEQLETQTYNKNRRYIEPMIYAMLSTTNETSITMDMHELMSETAMVNKDFNYIKWHTKECAEIIKQDEVGLEIFTKESEPMLKRIIRDILYDMQDRQLIKVTEIPVVAYRTYDVDRKLFYTTRHEITEEKEVADLLEIKRKILAKFNVQKETELNYHERSYFRDLIAKEYGAHYFYYKYNIILNKIGLTETQDCDIIELKKSFNNHIQEKINNSKQGGLKNLTKEEKNIYIKYCIDITKDYKLRYLSKENI